VLGCGGLSPWQSSSDKGKRRKKEARQIVRSHNCAQAVHRGSQVSREEVRRKAEEAARRWQERDDQVRAVRGFLSEEFLKTLRIEP